MWNYSSDYIGPDGEWEYGCVKCQKYHGESDGPIYAEHIGSQSKHGLRRRPRGGWLATASCDNREETP